MDKRDVVFCRKDGILDAKDGLTIREKQGGFKGIQQFNTLISMNAGDSYRGVIEPQSSRWIPASSRLIRGFRACFLLQIPTMGILRYEPISYSPRSHRLFTG